MPRIFEYSVDSPQLGTLVLSFAAAFLSGFLASAPPSARRTGARVLSVALLAVLSQIVGGPLLLTGALLVFAAGDALLAQDDDRASQLGLAVFFAGYLGYAVLFLRGAEAGLYLAQPWRIVIALLLPLAVWPAMRSAIAVAGPFRLPVMASLALSPVPTLVALGTVLPGLIAGSILLVTFAVFLALRFGPAAGQPQWRTTVGWIIYYAGHLLITLSALALL